ncbi:hypothetical protein DFA_08474 [Cavenderia fasciculata]|uniref:Protein kinase domain-containing protein n=1 Tax=Cavenderia fasciculata TaxID=261658 RepID=F4Q6A4_CACFS|nr:uncharacterized protein DFA_08474 [Cavenderia fasciculata]EGG17478.1 hypothetical protein DFA_08474 [Cavenderia fasciculata]|eukprot:XP_004355962.1 hypothetical protein DFA_08474 [Cavenderia fasciculata]
MTVHTEKTIYDDYEITDIIGEGTFSTVTLAYHKNTLEKYAVKIIDKEFLNSHRREMVDWEISILSKCDHPSIVDDDESTVYRLVSQGTWEFPPNTTVSDDVKDYIGKLLEQDPSKRLTAKQALSHKWMGDSNYYNNNHNYNSTRIIEIEPSSSVLLPTSNPVSSSSSSQQCGLSSSSSSSSLSSLSSSMAPDLHIIESFLTPQKPEFIPTSIRSSLQRSFEQHMQQQQQIMQQQTNNINNSNNYNQPESIPHMRLSSQSNSTLSLSSSSSSIRNSNSTSSSNLLKSPIRNSSNQTTIPLSPQKSSQPISIQNSHLRNSLNSSVDAFRTNNSPTMFNNPNV